MTQGQRRFGPPGSDGELGQIFSEKYFGASLQQNDGSFLHVAGTLRGGFLRSAFRENFML